MSDKVNPVILIQLLYQYYNYRNDGERIFRFIRNERMLIHRETEQEVSHRKSRLSPHVQRIAAEAVRKQLRDSLKGRITEKIYIDPAMRRIAVPIQTATGQNGFDILPTGSRITIPKGKKIRAFTYWEKVNDIDLSCFGVSENGQQKEKEFSWRTMFGEQSDAVLFSGDETSGYNGGSEYYDIDMDEFQNRHPDLRYLVFCNNIFSDSGRTHFKDCFCKAGFMMRDISDSGEVYEPKTVKTAFRMTTDSSFGYLFAIDLKMREMVWLNINREGNHAIAGQSDMAWLMDFLKVTDVFNVYDLYAMCAGADNIAETPHSAKIVVTADDGYTGTEDQMVVYRWSTEKMLQLLQ